MGNEEHIGVVQQPLVGGNVISAGMRESFGLVTLGSICSAALLTDDWVITAAHCIYEKDTNGNEIVDPNSRSGLKTNTPGSITLTADWSTAQSRTVDRIEPLPGLDIALLHVSPPFVNPHFAHDTIRPIDTDGPAFPQSHEAAEALKRLQGKNLTLFGRGIFQFAQFSGTTPVPTSRDGQWRVGFAVCGHPPPEEYTDLARFWFSSDTDDYIAGGDSGGPSFFWDWARAEYVLAGVHSLTNTTVLPGQKKDPANPWQWIMATPWAGDAPLRLAWNDIETIVDAKPASTAGAAKQFVGVFPSGGPSLDQRMIATFQSRAELGRRTGFVAAFPNCFYGRNGLDILGGTIVFPEGAIHWRDVPLAELGNAPLGDFGQRMRATSNYAVTHGFVGGFPTFYNADFGSGTVCGTYLLTSDVAEWRDVRTYDLNIEDDDLDDYELRFRATQEYAQKHGCIGGFPNMYHAKKDVFDIERGLMKNQTVCGTVLIKPGAAAWRDLVVARDPS